MDDPDTNQNNIKPFPSARERERRVLLRAANDGGEQHEPAVNLPPAVKSLCLLLIAAHLAALALPYLFGGAKADAILMALAFIPARYGEGLGLSALVSPVTHMFLHAGWLHLAVNVFTLMAFGAGLEMWRGGRAMLGVFFFGGAAAAFCQFALDPGLSGPLVGASGGVSALFGALLVEMNARGVLQGQGRRPLLIFSAVWIATSLFFGLFGVPGAEGDIAWAAHIGGFAAGVALGLLWRKLD